MRLCLVHESSMRQFATWYGMPKSDHNCVYRGMDVSEWNQIRQTGAVNSAGHHLYPEQRGGTCYGIANGAIHYGVEVHIWNGRTGYYGVVIEVPRAVVLDHDEDRRVHQGEFMHFGILSSEHIRRAWLLTPLPTPAHTNHVHCRIEPIAL